LLLWLTVNFTDLCISMYIYTPYPPLAPAHPPSKACVRWHYAQSGAGLEQPDR